MSPFVGTVTWEAPSRQLSAGGWGSIYKHWIQLTSFPYFPPNPCIAGFSGEALDSPSHHFELTAAASSVPRRVNGDYGKSFHAGGINPDYFYRFHYIHEHLEYFYSDSDAVDHLRTRFDRDAAAESDIREILPEPVLPVGKPGSKVPCGAWQTLYEECLKKHGSAPAGKCEYLRCKTYECNVMKKSGDGVKL